MEVLHDPRRFSSTVMSTADPVLLGADPPAHTKVKEAVTRALPHARGLEPFIWEETQRLTDHLRGFTTPDLVKDFARPLTLTVMAELLGLRSHPWQDLARWTDAVVTTGTGYAAGGHSGSIRADMAELQDVLARAVLRSRSSATPDVLRTLLLDPRGPLREPEVASIGRLLLVAGSETTARLIGSSLMAVLGEPSLAAAARAGGAEKVVDAVLHRDPPVRHVVRVTTRECSVGDHRCPAGSLLLVRLQEDANEGPRSHQPWTVPFGTGPHACPGAALAVLEAAIGVRAILRRWPGVRPAESLQQTPRQRTDQLHGPLRLRVHLMS
jgi:cytochrome P450